LVAYITYAKNQTIHLRSFDGDSVAIHGPCRDVSVAQKFLWQVPEGVRVRDAGPDEVDVCGIVEGKVPIPKVRPIGHNANSRSTPMLSAEDYRNLVISRDAASARKMELARAKIDDRFKNPKLKPSNGRVPNLL
jgi:hypothetical protein